MPLPPVFSCRLEKIDSKPGRPAAFKVNYRVIGIYAKPPIVGERFYMNLKVGEFKGGFFMTSVVTRIISNIKGCIRFETENSVYKLTPQ